MHGALLQKDKRKGPICFLLRSMSSADRGSQRQRAPLARRQPAPARARTPNHRKSKASASEYAGNAAVRDLLTAFGEHGKLVPPLSKHGADSEATNLFRCAPNAGPILRPESGPDFGPANQGPMKGLYFGGHFAGPKSGPDSGLRIGPALAARRCQFVASESAPRADSGGTNFL